MKFLLIFLMLQFLLPDSPKCDEQAIKQTALHTPIIVVAEIIEVKPEVGIWSGYTAFVQQQVRYQVKEILKGKLSPGEIEVGHFIIKNSPTVDSERARLSPRLFAKGKLFILFLTPVTKKFSALGFKPERMDRAFFVDNYECGALPVTTERIKAMRHILAKSESRP